jgi:hypothetical protein
MRLLLNNRQAARHWLAAAARLALLASLMIASLALADAPTPNLASGALQKDALALLTAWVDAQNRGDAAAYVAFYDKDHFQGVKRTARGGKKKFDYAGWIADRTAMLKKHPKVEAANPMVATWQEGKLKPGVIAIRFLQRWRSDRYADHGPKMLHLLRTSGGKLQIIYEDLLSSEPGWDAQAQNVAKLILQPPKSDDDALAIWKKIAPTGSTVADKLEAITGTPGVTRSLARSILASGNFECKKVVEVGECGDDSVSWEELDPKADLDDPCLRRRLADWALTKGGLNEADVKAIADQLLPLLKLDRPEEDLPPHLLDLVDSMSTATRLRFLHAAPGELAEKHLDGLPEKALAELYREDHLDNAALGLDLEKSRALVLEALYDGKLGPVTRSTLLKKVDSLSGKDVAVALGKVADGAEDCELAMNAALALETRGDKSHLPRRRDADDQGILARKLCMLVHEPDSARQLAFYKEFLPPRGKVKISEHIDDDWADRDENGNRVDLSPEDQFFTRKSATFNFDSDFGTKPGLKVDTSDGYLELTFEAGKDAKLYLMEIHRYRWHGCPC